MSSPTGPAGLDHLVIATPDVESTSAWIESMTGVRPSVGGPHLGRGTRNVLCSLGPSAYVEIIGPDPGQPEPPSLRPFGVDVVVEPTLVTWCLRPAAIDRHIRRAADAGVRYTVPEPMSRRSPDGVLEWRLAFVDSDDHGGILPFVIDWGVTSHPAPSAAAGLELVRLDAGHPDPEHLESILVALDVELQVEAAGRRCLRATLEGPAGRLEFGL